MRRKDSAGKHWATPHRDQTGGGMQESKTMRLNRGDVKHSPGTNHSQPGRIHILDVGVVDKKKDRSEDNKKGGNTHL